MKRLICMAIFFISSLSFGQDKIKIEESDYNNEEVEMADTLRSNGKIYVVVGVVLVILLTFTGYIIVLDRKVAKLERYLANDDENHEA